MTHRIVVRHPGYNIPNMLFVFPASDGTNRDQAHYATIWTACSIIINNRQDHWLSSSSNGEPKLRPDANGLMYAGEYFLHVPSADADASSLFPIVPTFRTWRYPHGHLPPLWAEASQSNTDHARHTNFSIDSIAVECCRITNRKLEVDNAHVIPLSEKPWFINNEMAKYGNGLRRTGEIIADSLANMLRLRCDAHRLWDKLNFSIVPREDHTAESGGATWFTQALDDNEELLQYWHRQKLESLAGRPSQYLFARFAWDIFPKLHEFLQAGNERQLIVWTTAGRVETRGYSGPECRRFTTGQGRNRSASSTKRARSESSNHPNELEELQCDEDSQTSDGDSPASGHFPSPHHAGYASKEMHRSRNGRKHGVKTETEQEWHRYIYGHDVMDEHRGRKRFRA